MSTPRIKFYLKIIYMCGIVSSFTIDIFREISRMKVKHLSPSCFENNSALRVL